MDTSAALSVGLTRTPARGWAVALLSRLQMSSIMLTSFTLGVFLPFIRQDLQLSPLQAGLLQGVSWSTSALMALPSGVWFSRFRPVPLVLASLLLSAPFLFLQGLAWHFLVLLVARLCLVLCHEIATPARPLLLQQWVAPQQYAVVNAVGLSQHSILMAAAISTSAWLIMAVGSWRLAYYLQGGFLVVQTLAWVLVARERQAPIPAAHLQRALQAAHEAPLRALWLYPQGWLLGITMFSLAATWTTVVTFLPTLLLERGVTLALGGPVLACLYYGLIPCAPFAGLLARKVQQRKLLLWVPALCNTVLGLAIVLTPSPWLLMGLLTGMGVVWIVSPTIEVLPFEFPGIRPREVAVIASLVKTLSGLGFALGPVVTGVVTQYTGSLQTGCLTLCALTGVGIIAGLLYPSTRPPAEAAEVIRS
jgi:CP family cyanate transporter-like MFS transporter